MEHNTNKEQKMEYKIEYSNHDKGAQSGSMVRETAQRAERTAKLMKECGYRTVTVNRAA